MVSAQGCMASREPRYWAVIPSAGGGSRMGMGRPKQYLPLCGRTLIEWSIGPFLDAGWIDGVVVVLARGDSEFAKLSLARHPKLLIAIGGASRAESVLAGLVAVDTHRTNRDAPVYALIHEASRPCLIVEDLERLREEASDEHGGLLALPLNETLKRESRERAVATVEGHELWRAQTPQLFRADLLRSALKAVGDSADESDAMERAGHKPHLIRGRDSNLKVTYPEDLQLAEFWLSRQEYVR
jgi:2-C-methyl-D-erythritol 4-phosphate cytidylyltransferase